MAYFDIQKILPKRASQYGERIALIDSEQALTYEELAQLSEHIARQILQKLGSHNLDGERIAYIAEPSANYALMQWAIWQAGGVAVPISVSHPRPEVEYILDDTEAALLIGTQTYQSALQVIAQDRQMPFCLLEELKNAEALDIRLPEVFPENPALIIYTSGTTSRPKGVLTTQANISAQVQTLVKAWQWQSDDYILLLLPLHHIHGIINVLSCALWSGAKVEILAQFDAERVWELFAQRNFSLFMAVPTIYHRLIAAWENATPEAQYKMNNSLSKFRLMVSGSAALPVSVLEKWKNISGHTLLERYGMTEIGMAISNPLAGERKAGHIGLPLPNVAIRLVDEAGKVIKDAEQAGEIQVKSSSVFREYWQKPQATAEAFTEDGWFRTGDIAERDRASAYYRILGRNSVDIIKSGGYKISALEIESILLQHPNISECAVVGIPSEDWGEQVAAAVVSKNDWQNIDFQAIRNWAKHKLAHYKVPTRWQQLEALPRNAMGKVQKPEIKKNFNASY